MNYSARHPNRWRVFSCANSRLAFAPRGNSPLGMSPHDQARSIFRAVRYDSAAIQVQRDAYIALTASITSATGGTRITSGTENGQSFTASYEKKEAERLQVLTILMVMIERNSAGSKSTLGRFA